MIGRDYKHMPQAHKMKQRITNKHIKKNLLFELFLIQIF